MTTHLEAPADYFLALSPEAQSAIVNLMQDGFPNEEFVTLSEKWRAGEKIEIRAPWDKEEMARSRQAGADYWAPHLAEVFDHSACEPSCPESDFLGMRD